MAPIFVEYILIGEVNDMPECAHELGQLLRGKKVVRVCLCFHRHVWMCAGMRVSIVCGAWTQTLNLIPYNPSTVPDKFFPPSPEAVRAFQLIVMTEYSVFTTVRGVAFPCLLALV